MVVEAGFTPNGEQFAGGNPQDQYGVNPIDALVEQTRLNVSDIGQYYDMWVGLLSESELDFCFISNGEKWDTPDKQSK